VQNRAATASPTEQVRAFDEDSESTPGIRWNESWNGLRGKWPKAHFTTKGIEMEVQSWLLCRYCQYIDDRPANEDPKANPNEMMDINIAKRAYNGLQHEGTVQIITHAVRSSTRLLTHWSVV
jgi:hypothetical protein